MHLRGLDLNLLIALDALLSERNVTRAAERMNISQPGMSAVLAKLRWHFSDQLLEKVGRRLELTPRGAALAGPVKNILAEIRALNDSSAFDPATTQRVFRMKTSTFCVEILAVPMIQLFQKIAPRVSVEFGNLSTDTVPRLVYGDIDFILSIPQAVSNDPLAAEIQLQEMKLFCDHMVLAVAVDNRNVGDVISFDELCELPSIETRFDSHMPSLSELTWQRQPRLPHVCAWFPNLLLTLEAVAQTDMIAIMPSRQVAIHRDKFPVRTLAVPFELPVIDERLYWHPRNNEDPAHRWFRDALRSVVEDLGLAPSS